MIRAYEVRIQVAAGRLTRRVAAVDAAEARAQCAALGEVVSVRRSQYAVGLAERRARSEWLAASR